MNQTEVNAAFLILGLLVIDVVPYRCFRPVAYRPDEVGKIPGKVALKSFFQIPGDHRVPELCHQDKVVLDQEAAMPVGIVTVCVFLHLTPPICIATDCVLCYNNTIKTRCLQYIRKETTDEGLPREKGLYQ
jgi:hypothetical protein